MKIQPGPALPPPPDPPCDHWLPTFGCKPPMNATWIVGLVPAAPPYVDEIDRLHMPKPPIGPTTPRRIHWAEGGGEEQPPFRGWFVQVGPHEHFGVEPPIAWRPETGTCSRCGAPLQPLEPTNG